MRRKRRVVYLVTATTKPHGIPFCTKVPAHVFEDPGEAGARLARLAEAIEAQAGVAVLR